MPFYKPHQRAVLADRSNLSPLKAVAKATGASRKAIRLAKRKSLDTESPNPFADAPRSGRPPVWQQSDKDDILAVILANTAVGPRGIVQMMADREQKVTLYVVRQVMKEHRLKR